MARLAKEAASSAVVDLEEFERESRQLFDRLHNVLSNIVENVERLPVEVSTLPGLRRRQARAVAGSKKLYEPAVAFLADADRIRALKGMEFIEEAASAMSPFNGLPIVAAADEAQVIAEARAARDANQ